MVQRQEAARELELTHSDMFYLLRTVASQNTYRNFTVFASSLAEANSGLLHSTMGTGETGSSAVLVMTFAPDTAHYLETGRVVAGANSASSRFHRALRRLAHTHTWLIDQQRAVNRRQVRSHKCIIE